MAAIARSLAFYPFFEKLWLLIDVCQVYTLIWNASQPWYVAVAVAKFFLSTFEHFPLDIISIM